MLYVQKLGRRYDTIQYGTIGHTHATFTIDVMRGAVFVRDRAHSFLEKNPLFFSTPPTQSGNLRLGRAC